MSRIIIETGRRIQPLAAAILNFAFAYLGPNYQDIFTKFCAQVKNGVPKVKICPNIFPSKIQNNRLFDLDEQLISSNSASYLTIFSLCNSITTMT